jgi:hypothetical protein
MFESILRGPPYHLRLTPTKDEPFKVSVPLSRDLAHTRIVFVETIFSLEVSFREPAWEIHFPISVITLDGSDEGFSTYDRNECLDVIPSRCRAHIMPIVCASCDLLIERLDRPRRLYFVTYMPLPSKALGKYVQLKSHLEGRGYRTLTDAGTDGLKRTFWELGL